MNAKKIVVFGFTGTTLDGGKTPERWNRWRPTVSLAQQADLKIDRIELFFNGNCHDLVNRLTDDIGVVSPLTLVNPHNLPIVDSWDFESVYAALFEFANNYVFDTENEEYFVHITTGSHVAQICLFLLSKGSYFPAKLLQTSPPRRSGDVGSSLVIDLDLSKYDKLIQVFSKEHKNGTDFLKLGIATRNKSFNAMIDQIENVAIKSKSPILLMGATGAGKSFLAKRIYDLKKLRRQLKGNFVEVNCATLRGDGSSSTLFGHVKGAFTGAISDRPGLLLRANHGTLFLDEIGDLPFDVQTMLLKAIEEKSFYPMGSDMETASDFQLIAGTNKDLSVEVKAGRFREDLFSRINMWSYTLPKLMDRTEDIEPNVVYMTGKLGSENDCSVRFNKEAHQLYINFATSSDAIWAGNFRDLSASVTRMSTLSAGGRITEEIVASEIGRLKKQWAQVDDDMEWDDLSFIDDLPIDMDKLDLFDQIQLKTVLSTCKKSRSLSDAGRKLFAISRESKTKNNDADRLKKYLSKFNLTWDMLIMQHTKY
jgi:transcriptional regulatory protein RtcR